MPEMESQVSLYRQELDGASHSDAGDDDERTLSSVTADDDDDDTVPIWFRQISSGDSVAIVSLISFFSFVIEQDLIIVFYIGSWGSHSLLFTMVSPW